MFSFVSVCQFTGLKGGSPHVTIINDALDLIVQAPTSPCTSAMGPTPISPGPSPWTSGMGPPPELVTSGSCHYRPVQTALDPPPVLTPDGRSTYGCSTHPTGMLFVFGVY